MLLLWIAATHYEPTKSFTPVPKKPRDDHRLRIMQDDEWLILHVTTKKP